MSVVKKKKKIKYERTKKKKLKTKGKENIVKGMNLRDERLILSEGKRMH